MCRNFGRSTVVNRARNVRMTLIALTPFRQHFATVFQPTRISWASAGRSLVEPPGFEYVAVFVSNANGFDFGSVLRQEHPQVDDVPAGGNCDSMIDQVHRRPASEFHDLCIGRKVLLARFAPRDAREFHASPVGCSGGCGAASDAFQPDL